VPASAGCADGRHAKTSNTTKRPLYNIGRV
jgi:hypothetical protein